MASSWHIVGITILLILHVCSLIFLCNSVNAVYVFIFVVSFFDISALDKTQFILRTLLFNFSAIFLQVFLDSVGFLSNFCFNLNQ